MTDLTLSPAEADAVIALRLTQITPRRRPQRPPDVRPRVVLIAGQPGAGKSTTQNLVHDALGQETTASYDFDDNASAHPRYDEIMRSGKLDIHRDIHESLPPSLHRRCLDHLRKGDPQYDVIASAPLGWEEGAKSLVDGFARENYRVTVVYLATNDANSLLSVADRYQRAKDEAGIGRWVADRLHDRAYRGVPDAAHALESQAYVDDIYVVDRDGNVLFENHRKDDGTMERPPGAREAINAERDRPPTQAERAHFMQVLGPLQRHDPELEEPVADMVSEALHREAARPAPAEHQRDSSPQNRIDGRLAALQHVTGSGVAPPSGITPPASSPAARSGQSRSPSGQTLDR